MLFKAHLLLSVWNDDAIELLSHINILILIKIYIFHTFNQHSSHYRAQFTESMRDEQIQTAKTTNPKHLSTHVRIFCMSWIHQKQSRKTVKTHLDVEKSQFLLNEVNERDIIS